jgi:uncharacterized protein YjbI with pentapeptide repeats
MPKPIAAYWEALPVWITFGLAVLAALLLATAIWWLWWQLPKREAARLALKIRDAKARADVEDNYRKTVGQALGGIAVLLGAGLAYLQFSQQQRASELQSSQQQRAAHDLLISNQVSKGFEQLGSEKVVIRLGGIYALEGVMNGSDQYHQAVLEALCAFVREGAKLTTPPTPEPPTPPPTDIQAALTVIGRRLAGSGGINLSEAKIADADLNDADLSNAKLNGADLTGAGLTGANLTGASLAGAYLTGASLAGAKLTGAILIGANLTGANLTGANLTGAKLTGANLSYADLTRADLEQQHLDAACGSDAKLPSGLTLKPCQP